MKGLIILIFMALLIGGCSSEFWKHDTHFKTNDHMWFSISGHKNVDSEDARKSKEQGWWGTGVPYKPDEPEE